MKKRYAVFVLFLLFLPNVTVFCQAEEITFSSLLPPVAVEKSINNAEYLLGAIGNRQDIKALFSDIDSVKQFLWRWINALPHSHSRLPCKISAEPDSVFAFSLPQLIRVYLILNSLQNGDLVVQIGKIIENYQEGNYYEPGGLGLIKNGQIILEQRPSELFLKVPEIEAAYAIPDKDFAKPHVFLFHMHPFGKGPSPGPSWGADFTEGKEANIKYDIGTALKRAGVHGDYHHLLISKLGDRRFNVDYYFAEKIQPLPHYDSFQFCHRLTGFRIVDLGDWRY